MKVAVLVVAVLAAVVCALPPFKGVLVTGQFRCDDFLCPDWELDVARVDPSFRPHDLIIKLAELVPKSPVASMSFPVITAYHERSRTFYTAGLPDQSGGTIWAVAINSGVNTSAILFSTRFVNPVGNGQLSRIQVSSNNTVYGIFQSGLLASFNIKTGAWQSVGTVVPSNYTTAKVTAASTVDQESDVLYTFLMASDGPVVTSLNLASNRLTSAPVALKREHWSLEGLPTAVWISARNELGLIIAGLDSGFDQIASINPATGAGTFLNDNLAESNLFFTCDMSTKSCDLLQTAAYDAIENRLYFQATEIMSQDDVGTTVLMYLDLAAKQPYIDTGLNPFTFGYMGFNFVPVLA